MNPARIPPDDAARAGGAHLRGLSTSLRARFAAIEGGFLLEIEPLSTVEAFSLWPTLVPARSSSLLIAIDEGDDAPPALTASRFAAGYGERLDDTAVVVPAAQLADLAVVTPADTLVAVAIDGPIEPADARALRRSTRAGRSPLSTEVRAVLAATAIGERALRIETREPRVAAAFLGEALRGYVASILHRWPSEIGRPDPGLVLTVLERTGYVSVRAIETEVYPTSIDVGLGTHADGAARPAQTSLIYDVCSATWHGE